MDERSFYAAIAPYYDFFYDFGAPGGKTEQEVDFLAWAIGDHEPSSIRILDVACGTGRHLIKLLERGYDASGFDLSPDMIGIAHDKLAATGHPTPLHIGDMRDIPAELGPVDVLCSWLTAIAHMQTNADLLAAFRSFASVMKPGGLLVLETINHFWITDKFLPSEDMWIATADGFIHRHVTRKVNYVAATLTHAEHVLIGDATGVHHRHYSSDLRGLSWPELQGYLHQAGFIDVTLYGDASARVPAITHAPRLLVTARTAS